MNIFYQRTVWMRAVLVVFFGCFSPNLHAELEWTTTVYKEVVKEGQKEAKAKFVFTNKGGSPLTIKSVAASCKCTTATTDKTVYEPDESGEVSAVFDIGKRKGSQEKSIVVTTDDKRHSYYVLLLRIDIPEFPAAAKPIASNSVNSTKNVSTSEGN